MQIRMETKNAAREQTSEILMNRVPGARQSPPVSQSTMDAEDTTMRIKSSTALRQATSIVTSDGIDRNYDIAVSISALAG